MEGKEFLEAGKIINTHGIAGDVVVESYCDSPEVLMGLSDLYLKKGEEYAPLSFGKAVPFKGRVLCHFKGFDSVEAVIPLKNRLVYARRSDFRLAPGQHFIADLLGLPVLDEESGVCYGHLSDVLNYGAGDLYEITRPDGKKAYVPVVPFVKKVDPESGIVIAVIEGLL